jgi:predicted metal-dependent peptidase
MRVLFQVPFFAPGVAKLPVVWDPSIPTACTAGDNIRFNPEFFDKCKDQELVTVLCHEVAHCLLGHIWRAPGGADWDVWNQATDHAVNNMLKEFAEQVTAKRLADPFPFPDEGSICCNPAFRGNSEEQIYNMLATQKPPQNAPGRSKGSKGSGKGSAAAPGPTGGAANPGFGQIAPGNQDPTVQKKDKASWEHTLIQSVQAAKGRGELPGCMERFVDELLNPSIPWWELVRQWLREKVDDDWNWMKPNPYFDESPFILPSLDSERMGPIVFATDTSGSIDHVMLQHFQSEKQNCLDDLKPAYLLDICCDSKIQQVKEYRAGETISTKAPGGGGTDFRPVFDEIESRGITPKCVVYLTDLDGAFPKADPGYPVLWVAYGGGEAAPFGEVVQAS